MPVFFFIKKSVVQDACDSGTSNDNWPDIRAAAVGMGG